MAGVPERQECLIKKKIKGLDIKGEKKRKFKGEYWVSHLCRWMHGGVITEIKNMEEDKIEDRGERNHEYRTLLYFFLYRILSQFSYSDKI